MTCLTLTYLRKRLRARDDWKDDKYWVFANNFDNIEKQLPNHYKSNSIPIPHIELENEPAGWTLSL
jgi:hypothetical protein